MQRIPVIVIYKWHSYTQNFHASLGKHGRKKVLMPRTKSFNQMLVVFTPGVFVKL